MSSRITPEFFIPSEIYIKRDILKNAAELISRHGNRPVILTTSPDFENFNDSIDSLYRQLKKNGSGCIIYDELPKSPSTEDIDHAAAFLKKTNADMIIAFGSVESLNAAKALSLLVRNYIFCHDLFSDPYLPNPAVPIVMIPAYPAYGFEISPVFFINEIHNLTKRPCFNEKLYPKALIVDPNLSLDADEDTIIRAAISALSISTEAIISKKSNDIANTFALKSIDLIFRNLPTVYREPKNANPRIFLSTASVMSGIAFSSAYLSVTLSISLALASRTDISVENAMSLILPHVMEFNLTTSPGKYVQMSKVMGEEVRDITVIEAAIKAIEAIRKLETDVAIPQRLSQYNIQKNIFKPVAELAISYPFIDNAPRPLNTNEIETILIAAY